jgi:hypothetical protein
MNQRFCQLVALGIGLAALCGCNKSPAPPQVVEAQTFDYSTPPRFNDGLTVEQAYAAIPHRRTVWDDAHSTATPSEKAYLKTIFDVLDQATAVRVSGLKNYSSGHIEYSDPDSEFQQLIDFANGMTSPPRLQAYHKDILDALAGERQFFVDWKMQGDHFANANSIQNHPGVQRSDQALHAAYAELMSRFPADAQANKVAFFDYHCALDFL